MDPQRTYVYNDVVYGAMKFRPDVMSGATDDPIIVKSDGWPTYHLASVVDDTEMRITHVPVSYTHLTLPTNREV